MTIPLTQGKVAIVSAEDYERINQYKWCAVCNRGVFYAARCKNGRTVFMHSMVLTTDPGKELDHIDCDGLNNQRHNLRPATRGQNTRNRNIQSNNTSGFKGVSWHKVTQKWRATIKIPDAPPGKFVHLGLFLSKEDAAAAYDSKAVELYGDFARTNQTIYSR